MTRRVLVVAPFPPRLGGVHGGSRAMAGLIAAAGERHAVGLLYLRGPSEPSLEPELVARCALTQEVFRPEPARRPAGRALARGRRLVRGLRGQPGWVTALPEHPLAAGTAALARRFAPHVVQLEGPVLAGALGDLDPTVARVLVVHEPAAAAAREHSAHARGVRRAMRRIDARAWTGWEARALAAVDLAVVFSERDRRTVAASTTPIEVVRPGTALPIDALDAAGADPPGVLFIGNFGHPPNAVAARALVERILPAVRRRLPATPAWLVGPGAPPELSAVGDGRTAVPGLVADTTPYLDRAAVVVAPMWSGGGVRVKVLEALAAGKAVVATPLALEGIGVRAGEHVLAAAEPDAFAAAVVELLADRRRRIELGRNARGWAVANLGWDAVVDRYERAWERALALHGRRG